jgi:hypothetical protein
MELSLSVAFWLLLLTAKFMGMTVHRGYLVCVHHATVVWLFRQFSLGAPSACSVILLRCIQL